MNKSQRHNTFDQRGTGFIRSTSRDFMCFLNFTLVVDFWIASGILSQSTMPRDKGLFRYLSLSRLRTLNFILFLLLKFTAGLWFSKSSCFLLTLYITTQRCSALRSFSCASLYRLDRRFTSRFGLLLLSIIRIDLFSRFCN